MLRERHLHPRIVWHFGVMPCWGIDNSTCHSPLLGGWKDFLWVKWYEICNFLAWLVSFNQPFRDHFRYILRKKGVATHGGGKQYVSRQWNGIPHSPSALKKNNSVYTFIWISKLLKVNSSGDVFLWIYRFKYIISSHLFLSTLFTHCFTSPLPMFMFSLADRYDVFFLVHPSPTSKNNGRLARDPYRRCHVRLARQEIECGRNEERRQQPVKKQ